MILPCSNPACKSEFQDSKYGKNNRVFNRMLASEYGEVSFRCTICLNVTTPAKHLIVKLDADE